MASGTSIVAPWSVEENAILSLAQTSGKSAATIVGENLLPGRSKRSISQRLLKFARIGLTDKADGLEPAVPEYTDSCEPNDYVKKCMQDEAAAREKADAEARQRWNRISSRNGAKNAMADTFSTRTSQLAAAWSKVKEESEESADEEIVRFTTTPSHMRSSPPATPIRQHKPFFTSSSGENAPQFFTPDQVRSPEAPIARELDLQQLPTTQLATGAVEVPSTQLSDAEPTIPPKKPSRGRRYATRTDLGHLKSSPVSNGTRSDAELRSDQTTPRKRRKTSNCEQPLSKAKQAASEATDRRFREESELSMQQMRDKDRETEQQALIEKRAKAHAQRRVYIKMGLPLSPHASDSTGYSGDDETDDEA